VLAGSARHDAVPELADLLTGRVELLRLWPFARAELEPGTPSIVERPKLHPVDSGLAAHLQGVTAAEQLRRRTSDGEEVDLVLEAPDGRVVGVEVEGAGALTAASTRGLRHLRDHLGDRFVAGLVANTGSQAQQVDDRIWVAPVDGLWAA
jgi:predicted AAA+ superfamily ATPase